MQKIAGYIATALLLFSFSCMGNENGSEREDDNRPRFYSPESKGWFFYGESLFLENEEEPIQPQSTPQTASQGQPEMVALDVNWLRDNMPRMLDDMQNNPTDENIAKYVFAQRLLLDMSSRMQANVMQFMEENPILDENNRRPTTGMDLVTFRGKVAEFRKEAMDKVSAAAHIWFFYKADCDFCHRQLPILKAFHRRYGVTILAVSMDGTRIEGMENFSHRVDANRFWTREMSIERTPTLMLMMNDGSGFTKLTNGLETLPYIEERVMKIGNRMGLITDGELARAQEVLDINSMKTVDGTLLADKNRLENDANYFADLVRAQIEMNGNYFGNSNAVNEEQ